MIPRKRLLGHPQRLNPTVSPDGQHLAYLAPWDGVMNIWVAPVDDLASARPVSSDSVRPVFQYVWAQTSHHILYLQDVGGNEDWHVHSINLTNGETQDLTPYENISALVHGRSQKFPDAVLLAINHRDPVYHDLFRVNVETGESVLVYENKSFSGMISDDDFRARFGCRTEDDGSESVHRIDGPDAHVEIRRMPMEDCASWRHFAFDHTGRLEYWADSRGRDTSAFVVTDHETGLTEILATRDGVDVHDALFSPVDGTAQAVAFNHLRVDWQVLDPDIAADMEILRTLCDGELTILSRSNDDSLWTIFYMLDNGPLRFYLYDRTRQDATFLFVHRPDVEGLPLAKMHGIVIPARDGLELPSYLSLPAGAVDRGADRPRQPLPMVLLVHGGPWYRDFWGFNIYHQLLADRGYAVLAVNFRGSTGFGKAFVNAGNLEWGGEMHDDLIDAVDWAVAEGIAIPDKVAIMGGSYGGYAALVGMTMTPEKFACGVSIVGVSNLITLMENAPPYWKSWASLWTVRTGDHTTPEGREFLLSRSPITYVDQIKNPLIVLHGENDVRCRRSESDRIVEAMQQKNIPVTYLVYPDEGHGFHRAENQISSITAAELFLAQHLGGDAEPVGDSLEGSSVQIICGGDFLDVLG